MATPWSQVAQSPAYQALPPEQQEAARQQYFQQVVAPQVSDPAQLQAVRSQFDAATQPNARMAPREGDIVVRPTADQLAPPSLAEQAGRSFLRAGKAVGEGLAGTADLLATPFRAGVNAIARSVGRPDLQAGTAAQLVDQGAQALAPDTNLAPQGAAERYAEAIERGLGGVVGGMGAGNILARSGAPVVAKIGQVLQSNPGAQAASATTGATAAQGAKDAGFGALGQNIAAILGGAVPVLPQVAGATAQRLLAPTQEARQTVAQNIADFANAGTTPTVGQATQSPLARGAESLLAKTPGAVTVMKNAANQQGEQVANRLGDIAETLSPGADTGAAGSAIISGVSGPGGFVERFKDASKALYDRLDQHLPASQPVNITNTQQALADINAGIQGAKNTSVLMQNPKLVQIENAITADAQNGQLPYSAIKQLRTAIGDQLSDFQLVSDVPRANLKRLYGALSDDMQAAAQSAGPDAQKALAQANAFYKNGQAQIDTLQRVIDKNGGPEAVFNAAMSGTKEGSTTLNTVMDSLNPAQQRAVSAAVVNRLGKATPGAQNAAGDAFSMGTFLTNWNKLSPAARATLFDRYGPGFAKDMDAIANVAANVREGSGYLANPSGTAASGAQLGTVGALVMSVLGGHPGTAAAIAGGMGGANLTARLMTNPTFVKFLATKASVPAQGIPSALAALQTTANAKNDPDLKEAATALRQASATQGTP